MAFWKKSPPPTYSLIPGLSITPGSWGTNVRTGSIPNPRSPQTPKELPTEQSSELIVGYRRWSLNRYYPDGYTLRSDVGGESWKPRVRHTAACSPFSFSRWAILSSGYPSAHSAPDQSCSCGLFAYKDRVDLPKLEGPYVVGEVYLWGRVIEHEKGYRAQFAYPKRLVLVGGTPKIAVALSESYGVDCEVWE